MADTKPRRKAMPVAGPEGRMSLVDHFVELRTRVVRACVAIVIGMIIGYFLWHPIFGVLKHPYCKLSLSQRHQLGGTDGCSLNFQHPLDGFSIRLRVAAIAGVLIAAPVWLYQLWAFVAPGLYSREKRWTYAFIGTAVPLFGLGCFFAFLAMSRGLDFFIGMSQGFTILYSADTYIGYWIAMIIGFGLCFEVPLFLVILNLARVVTHERFKKWRRLIIFLVFVFAGIASPSPDPLTMLMLGGVVVVLVEAAEIFIYLNDRRWARNHPELTDEDIDNYEPAPVEASERIDADTSL
jgi:sec-independent protein translocase protein TatC